MKKIAFQKWEATGNDFLFVDSRSQGVEAGDIPKSSVVEVCDRETGIGADGVILYTVPDSHNLGRMTVINSDGSFGGMCGNALRCLAKILFERTNRARNQVEVAGRSVELVCEDISLPLVVMGEAEAISGSAFLESPRRLARIAERDGHLVSFGNPHFVMPVDRIPENWIALGESLQQPAHDLLGTGGINCGFVVRQANEEGLHTLRVFERGAGPTQACGSGACAASAVLQDIVGKEPEHEFQLPGGRLLIGRAGKSYTLKGPAERQFEGDWELQE